jgi:hypothetical protein
MEKPIPAERDQALFLLPEKADPSKSKREASHKNLWIESPFLGRIHIQSEVVSLDGKCFISEDHPESSHTRA